MRGSNLVRVALACASAGVCACADLPDQPPTAAGLAQALQAAPARSWAQAPLIPAYGAPVMATVHDKLTLFAASDEVGYSGTLDTWEWYGGAWTRRSPASAPSDRIAPGLARFADTLVMFGGFRMSDFDEPSLLYETWQWNGRHWTDLTASGGSPSPRYQPGFATLCNQVIAFGGQDGSTRSDTWIYDGRTWRERPDPGAPTGCTSPIAGFGTSALMFCSGTDPGDHEGHTYLWNGTRWTEQLTKTRPTRRYSHTLARYDDHIVMYGGYADSGNWQETWEWDGSDWHDRSVLPSPPARDGYQLHQQADELVLFGGGEGQTWTWNGAAWNVAAEATMPAQRHDYAIATLGDRAILFGGCCKRGGAGAPVYWDDTWAWDGARWSELSPATRPPGRQAAALAAVGGKLVLFGGASNAGLHDDTWTFDGATWNRAAVTTHPSARQRHSMTSWNGKVYLYGGASTRSPRSDAVLSDMWTWDGSHWLQVPMTGSAPGPGYDIALAGFGAQLALFQPNISRLWYWDGRAWSVASDDLADFLLARSSLTASDTRLVLSGDMFGQLYSVEWDGTTWRDITTLGFMQLGPIAAQGSSLVSLSGWPLRTWTYASR